MNESIENRLHSWLKEQGYPLEFRVAQAFQQAQAAATAFDYDPLMETGVRAGVAQSHYYSDPETDASREIDVMVTYEDYTKPGFLAGVILAIECKLSRDKPWILFTSDQPTVGVDEIVWPQPSSRLGRNFLYDRAQRHFLATLPLYAIPKRTAFAMTQAFTAGSDVAYKAALGAAKATVAICKEYDDPNAVVGFTAVVVDGALFQCYLPSAGGELIIEEVERGLLIWGKPVHGRGSRTVINVVTSGGLGRFVHDVQNTAISLMAAMGRNAPDLLAER